MKSRRTTVGRVCAGLIGALLPILLVASPAQAFSNTLPAVTVQALADVIVVPGIPPIAPAGPVEFPLHFTVADPTSELGFSASRLVVPSPAEGCTRVVNSLTTGFSVQAEAPVQVQFSILGSGPPIETVPGTTGVYSGDGIPLPFDPHAGLVALLLEPTPTVQSGVATITFAIPRDSLDVVGGFGVIRGINVEVPPTEWTLINATNDVTDTCPDPVAAAPAVLAATGAGSAPIGVTGTAALLLGAVVVTVSRVRRKNSR